ncbi:MAG: hypothetical protein Q4C70_05460 [Planctomycetia bacterium]|nr:hypothetical protein [Planctomycetia bacterium]
MQNKIDEYIDSCSNLRLCRGAIVKKAETEDEFDLGSIPDLEPASKPTQKPIRHPSRPSYEYISGDSRTFDNFTPKGIPTFEAWKLKQGKNQAFQPNDNQLRAAYNQQYRIPIPGMSRQDSWNYYTQRAVDDFHRRDFGGQYRGLDKLQVQKYVNDNWAFNNGFIPDYATSRLPNSGYDAKAGTTWTTPFQYGSDMKPVPQQYIFDPNAVTSVEQAQFIHPERTYAPKFDLGLHANTFGRKARNAVYSATDGTAMLADGAISFLGKGLMEPFALPYKLNYKDLNNTYLGGLNRWLDTQNTFRNLLYGTGKSIDEFQRYWVPELYERGLAQNEAADAQEARMRKKHPYASLVSYDLPRIAIDVLTPGGPVDTLGSKAVSAGKKVVNHGLGQPFALAGAGLGSATTASEQVQAAAPEVGNALVHAFTDTPKSPLEEQQETLGTGDQSVLEAEQFLRNNPGLSETLDSYSPPGEPVSALQDELMLAMQSEDPNERGNAEAVYGLLVNCYRDAEQLGVPERLVPAYANALLYQRVDDLNAQE